MMFRGQYAFLSNFATAIVTLDSMQYISVEHAFQAAKTLNPLQRSAIALATNPADAKRMGRRVTLRAGWDSLKLRVMADLLKQKFAQEPYRQKLLDTGTIPLVEENTWGDKYWGICNGVGQNHLGRLLMAVRSELVK